MIVTRFQETFRARMAEWVQSVSMATWGAIVLASPGLFLEKKEFYEPLLNIADQTNWGIYALCVGVIRFIFLIINGSWRPSAHMRAAGSIFSSMLWGALFIAALNLDWNIPASAIYGGLLVLDLVSLWFSAGDAKLADLSAKGKLI